MKSDCENLVKIWETDMQMSGKKQGIGGRDHMLSIIAQYEYN